MKPSELINKIQEWIKTCGDKEIYIHSSIEGKGTHIGRVLGVGADVEDGIILEIDIDSESTTR